MRMAASKYPELEPASGAAYVLLLRVASDMLAAGDEYLAKFSLSQGRFIVLTLLYRVFDLPQNPCVLAEKAGVTRATITGLVDTLERDGLVTREHDSGDRRMMLVHLTPKGHSTLREVLPGHFKQMAAQMASLTEHERKTLVRLLNKVAGLPAAAHIEAHSDSPTSASQPDSETATHLTRQ